MPPPPHSIEAATAIAISSAGSSAGTPAPLVGGEGGGGGAATASRVYVTESATAPPSMVRNHLKVADVADANVSVAVPNDGSRYADHAGCDVGQ